ncbi:hypothetical protein ACFQH5_14640 [Halomonas salifodinae]|uniref:DUF2135 domain-containing protein n=1 Tax=Halomonas salifodinae TaxID=438745 RepID=A0ABW2F3G0_9GAMM
MQRLLRDEGHALVDPELPKRQQALIHRHCPPSIGNLFALPRTGRDGGLEWWSELPGQPCPFAALSAAEQARLMERLTQRLAALGSLIDALERCGDPAAQALRGLPTQATEESLYSVGGDPVVIRWAPLRAVDTPPPLASSAPSPAQAPVKRRRLLLVPVMLPLLLGGLALLGLWLAFQHWSGFSSLWPQGERPIEHLDPQDHAEPALGTGDIQVTLRWNGLDDLDLAVLDPNGDTVFFANTTTPSGGELDVDSNAGCTTSYSPPIENIFWDSRTPPDGDYVATVTLYERCHEHSEPIPFELAITIDGSTVIHSGSVSNQSLRQSLEFSYP